MTLIIQIQTIAYTFLFGLFFALFFTLGDLIVAGFKMLVG